MSPSGSEAEKRSLLRKLGTKLASFKRNKEDEDLLEQTVTELKDLVQNMREIFEELEENYEEQVLEERNFWEKIRAKLPATFQNEELKKQERQSSRIRKNKEKLRALEANLAKIDELLDRGDFSEQMANHYLNILREDPRFRDKLDTDDVEELVERLKIEFFNAIEDLNTQISIIKGTLDLMVEQLSEQGVQLERIEEKVDIVDSKLDKAHALIKKVSRQITGNRWVMVAMTVGVVGAVAVLILK